MAVPRSFRDHRSLTRIAFVAGHPSSLQLAEMVRLGGSGGGGDGGGVGAESGSIRQLVPPTLVIAACAALYAYFSFGRPCQRDQDASS